MGYTVKRLLLLYLVTGGVALLPHAARLCYGQWVEAPGAGWAQLTVYRHETSSQFNTEGKIESFFADGHARTTSIILSGAIGIIRGIDGWIQVPLHALIFENAGGRRERFGPGDTRLYLRMAPSLVGFAALPVALRAGVKLPGGDFPVDAEVIPLGEGQRDWELMLELGHSFYPKPIYAMGWAGRRWREVNREAARKPGNEWFAFFALGGRKGAFVWKLVAEGWTGGTPRIQGIPVSSARQEMIQILPSIGWDAGPGVLELGLRTPIAGRNLPSGPAFFAGFFLHWPRR